MQIFPKTEKNLFRKFNGHKIQLSCVVVVSSGVRRDQQVFPFHAPLRLRMFNEALLANAPAVQEFAIRQAAAGASVEHAIPWTLALLRVRILDEGWSTHAVVARLKAERRTGAVVERPLAEIAGRTVTAAGGRIEVGVFGTHAGAIHHLEGLFALARAIQAAELKQ